MWISVGAALHDPEVVPEPERFDIGRAKNDALPFGFGAHSCLGASLAKVEIVSALRQLVERFPGKRPAGEPTWRSHMLLRGPSSVPVHLA